jgi:energy-coupling factor transport system permease protein
VAVPVPFGQYVPGESPVHRLEPRAKIALTVVFSIGLFLVGSWAGLALFAAAVVIAVALSGVPWRLVARGLAPIAVILTFTVLINAVVRSSAPDLLISVGPIAISGPGLARGLFFSLRIVILVLGTTLVTLTTSPVALTDAIARLLAPLERLRFPSTDVAMMLSVALRFIPTTAEEAETIVVAQAARGARFGEGNPVRRARAYTPVLVPLFVALFRRANDLALAMDARCYRGAGRTRLYESRLVASDWVTLVVGVVSVSAVAVYL